MTAFSRFKNLSKLQLVLLIAVFAAIPVTVGGVVAYRLVSPQAATGKPTSLTPAYSSTSTTPTFRWDCFCYTTKYRIHLREGDGNFFAGSWYKDVSKGSSNITSTSYGGFINNNYKAVPASLTVGKTYYWTVSCVTGGCNTATTMAFTVVTSDTQAPSVPGKDTLVLNIYGLHVVFGWTASTDNVGVKGYEVMRVSSDGEKLIMSPTTNPPLVLEDKTVRLGKGYKYSVRAYDAAGNKSAFTSEKEANFWSDNDVDGFVNVQEEWIGTNKDVRCGVNNWPPDFNNDGMVNVLDMQVVSTKIGTTERRYDLYPDGKVDAQDQALVSGKFGQSCTPVVPPPPPPS